MKKTFIYLAAVLMLGLFACNPQMQELIQQVEQSREAPYSESLDYTLTDDDYVTISTVGLSAAQNAADSAACAAIKDYKSFSEDRPAALFIPPFLQYKFPALDSGSYVRVTYNYDNTHIFTDDEVIILPTEAYDYYGISYFSPGDDVAQMIADWLNATNPDVAQGKTQIIFRYLFRDDNGNYSVKATYVAFDGQWIKPDFYMLEDADYENLAPNTVVAENHYFTSDYSPNTYIPVLLKVKFPYAIAGDEKKVIYNYFDGTVLYFHSNVYTFDGQNWNGVIQKTDQFANDGEKWAFDPTVKFEMSCSDYQIIVSWVQQNIPEYMHPVYTNTEYYFGASSYYCNFDMRLSTRRYRDSLNLLPADDQEAMKVLWMRLDTAINIVLETKFPFAQPEIYGIPVYYEVTFSTYEPERHKYMIKFLCTDVGKFTPVEQDGAIEYNPHIVLVQ